MYGNDSNMTREWRCVREDKNEKTIPLSYFKRIYRTSDQLTLQSLDSDWERRSYEKNPCVENPQKCPCAFWFWFLLLFFVRSNKKLGDAGRLNAARHRSQQCPPGTNVQGRLNAARPRSQQCPPGTNVQGRLGLPQHSASVLLSCRLFRLLCRLFLLCRLLLPVLFIFCYCYLFFVCIFYSRSRWCCCQTWQHETCCFFQSFCYLFCFVFVQKSR